MNLPFTRTLRGAEGTTGATYHLREKLVITAILNLLLYTVIDSEPNSSGGCVRAILSGTEVQVDLRVTSYLALKL